MRELEAMRLALRRLAPKMAALREVVQAVESNNQARVHAALIAYHTIDLARGNTPRTYSLSFKQSVVADCTRYGPTRAFILNGVPFDTGNAWYKAERRAARKAGRDYVRVGEAPNNFTNGTRKKPRLAAARPKSQVKSKIDKRIEALLSGEAKRRTG